MDRSKNDEMSSKYYFTHFWVPECAHRGCVNNQKGACLLHTLEFKKYVDQVAHIHSSRVCEARKQANCYKTESMLHD